MDDWQLLNQSKQLLEEDKQLLTEVREKLKAIRNGVRWIIFWVLNLWLLNWAILIFYYKRHG
jgi:hypothetical protein